MEKIILTIFLIFILVPISSAFSADSFNNQATLSVSLTSESPFVYKDDQGYTVVVGTVENKSDLTSVTNVRIHVNFYDDVSSKPLETMDGETSLKVIPPLGQSPYIIRSNSSNPNISQVTVSLSEGLNSSPSKLKQLTVELNDITLDRTLHFSGILKNSIIPINDTNIYLAFYDNFEPPRIIGVSVIPIGNVESNGIIDFIFNEKVLTKSVGFLLFSESNLSFSDSLDIKIPEKTTKLVTISNLSTLDSQGKQSSEIKVGSTVQIQSQSWIQFSTDQKSNETPYTYYVQIKQSGKTPFVEFVGKYDGRYMGAGTQFQSIDWIPEHDGLFFIETFVWDRNNIPIADQGPIALILVK
ncbi:MAG: hypothetical protein ITD33_07495 [Nitrosarchaeum sp.]|jgi:hypothetical protein|nr:hypothetical protein [Nitrosarchaeum sp.]MBP0120680.1 hypothetical protein [Nitrosarchaeum sp.]MBP0133903.1 hypothetical protein [Nitrosarchaeum sp.]MDW7641917.1 hypothetical protein [Nitrosarchaeum sp.]